jgi:hypothetical protein
MSSILSRIARVQEQIDVIESEAVVTLPAPSGGNDSAAIQAKINALPATGGRIIYRPGTYLQANVLPRNNLSVVIPAGTIIRQNATGAMFTWDNEAATQLQNVHFSGGGELDGNKSAGYANSFGMALERAKGIYVRDLYFHDTVQAGVLLGDPGDATGGEFWVQNCRFLNCGQNPSLIGNQYWGAIGFSGGDDIWVIGNKIKCTDGFANYAIDFEANSGLFLRRARAYFNECVGGGILGVAAGGGTHSDIWICHNSVDASNTSGGSMAVSVDATGRCKIIGNDIKCGNNTSPAVFFFNPTEGVVAQNTITGMGTTQNVNTENVGIYYGGLTGGLIVNNTIYAASPTHASTIAGIRDNGGNVRLPIVRGNKFHNITVKGVFQDGDIVLTADLPAAAAANDGLRLIEDGGAGNRNYILYAGGQRFRIDGGANV